MIRFVYSFEENRLNLSIFALGFITYCLNLQNAGSAQKEPRVQSGYPLHGDGMRITQKVVLIVLSLPLAIIYWFIIAPGLCFDTG